jgi:hypothetical protein
MNRYTFFVLAGLIAISSCKKTTVELPANRIENRNPYDIYVDIFEVYDGSGIATSHMNLIYHIPVPANKSFNADSLNLKSRRPLVYDWHSTDYRHSNWMYRPSKQCSFTGCTSPLVLAIASAEKGTSERAICLSGDGKATHWQTVDAYDLAGKSIWQTLSGNKYHQVELAYCSLIIDPNWEGAPYCTATGMQCLFQLTDTDRFWMHTYTADGPDVVLTDNAEFLAPLKTTATDTLFYLTRSTNAAGKIVYTAPIYKIAKMSTDYFELQH